MNTPFKPSRGIAIVTRDAALPSDHTPGQIRIQRATPSAPPQEQRWVARGVLELKVTADPETLIRRTVDAVGCPDLRRFLKAVLAEPEVNNAVSVPLLREPLKGRGRRSDRSAVQLHTRYPVDQLRRAGEQARYFSNHGAQERETLFVATVMRGVQELMRIRLAGKGCDVPDMVHTIARDGLRRLEAAAPRQAWLLRLAMGWGNDDDIDTQYLPRLQAVLNHALASVGLIPDSRPQQHPGGTFLQ